MIGSLQIINFVQGGEEIVWAGENSRTLGLMNCFRQY